MTVTQPISVEDLRRVSSARWLVPILAAMSAETGSRFGALVRTLQLSRSVLSRHLDLLETFGWIARNPGHGHPLRPEYLLTAEGCLIAAWSAGVVRQRAALGLNPNGLGRWSLPVLAELRGGWRRFSELERSLVPISPRALSLVLVQMADVRLVTRDAGQPLPPYGLTARGRDLATTLLFER